MEPSSRRRESSVRLEPTVKPPRLEVVNARIDVEENPVVDGLTLTAAFERTLVLGASSALFRVAGGLSQATHGEVKLMGMTAVAAVRSGVAAAAPLDGALPAKWTPRMYATWSSRLAGKGAGEARGLANAAMDAMKLGPAADVALGKLSSAARRATGVAGALATGAQLVLLEDPTAHLPEEQSRNLATAIVAALSRRAWVLFAPCLQLTSPLSMHADEAILVSGADVLARGAPVAVASRDRTYAVRLAGNVEDFRRLLGDSGSKTEGRGSRLVVSLADGTNLRDLLTMAATSSSTIVEVRPLARSFS